MRREDWFRGKWVYLKRFALLASIGIAIFLLGISAEKRWLVVPGVFLVVPLVFWLVLVPIYHWKDRYIGDRSKLWGALLVIETSGWFKIVYWFRHVLPDWNKRGRYQSAE